LRLTCMDVTQAREKFRTHLSAHGLRVTNQRLAIFDAAFGQKEHFTAEELLDYARALDDSVSRATVYRTLPHLMGSGVLREVDIGRNLKYYLPHAVGDGSAQVAQVICLDCDRIFEIGAPFMSWYGSSVAAKLGLTPVTQRLQVSARCDGLKAAGTCGRRG
jgi:Fur family transcriptional regulator, ferric uptake regulator